MIHLCKYCSKNSEQASYKPVILGLIANITPLAIGIITYFATINTLSYNAKKILLGCTIASTECALFLDFYLYCNKSSTTKPVAEKKPVAETKPLAQAPSQLLKPPLILEIVTNRHKGATLSKPSSIVSSDSAVPIVVCTVRAKFSCRPNLQKIKNNLIVINNFTSIGANPQTFSLNCLGITSYAINSDVSKVYLGNQNGHFVEISEKSKLINYQIGNQSFLLVKVKKKKDEANAPSEFYRFIENKLTTILANDPEFLSLFPQIKT